MASDKTRVVTSRDLVRQEAVQFIRAQKLTLTVIDARPLTKMFVFFDQINVNYISNKVGNSIGSDIITDSIGQVVIEINIPAGMFNTGDREIIVTDTNTLANLSTIGSTYGSAKATFYANGIANIFQEKSVTITTVERPRVINLDPLAQSFFTYGVSGGLFLSSVEVYFQTKDTTLPVRCEIRPMINGYPSSSDPHHTNFVSVLNPAAITTSTDGSVPTKFTFEPPLYLEENKDFCFVLRSNSNNYHVFTSKLGELSLEDSRRINEQPYIGSLFKSENAITWTAEQFEDIKFKINKAVFNTSTPASVALAANVMPTAAFGPQFSTVAGSKVVIYRHEHDHGLETNSKLDITTFTDGLYSAATYNGIPYAEFNGSHTVTYIDRKTVKFSVATTAATSTGPITSGNVVREVKVLNGGGSYTGSSVLSFTGGGGTGAAGTLTILNGVIQAITMTNLGTGYTSAPTVTASIGSGAILKAVVTPSFGVITNKPYQGFLPKISIENFATTKSTLSTTTTVGNYQGGNLTTYSAGNPLSVNSLIPTINTLQNSVIASHSNQVALMGGTKSALVTVQLTTDNPNVSPIINLNSKPSFEAYSYIIDNQANENLTSSAASVPIASLVITSGGSNYTQNPIVTISAPDIVGGTKATATATFSAGAVNTVTLTAAGSGYTSPPTVTVTRGVGDTTGKDAIITATLSTNFNSELSPSSGKAKSRYLTKRTTLQMVSSGIRLYSVLSSVDGSSVDWYIRTSLSGSGVIHDEQQWQLLSCATKRNKSSYSGEFFEYTFYKDDIADFDTYDLKCVLLAANPINSPLVKSYRVIIVA